MPDPKNNCTIPKVYNIAFEGYELIEIDPEYKSLSEIIHEKASEEGDQWKVRGKYDTADITDRGGQVLTTLMKCASIDRRNEWYLGKLRQQWDESVLIDYCPELLALENT